jgi:thiol-disulfide isomerase/thioredoxin
MTGAIPAAAISRRAHRGVKYRRCEKTEFSQNVDSDVPMTDICGDMMKTRLLRLLMCVFALNFAFAYAKSDAPKMKAGDIPPKSLGVTLNGDPVETTQFAGRVMVVTFWASWCGPCLREMSMLEPLQRAAKDRVKVVAVNIEDRKTFRKIANTLAEFQLTLTNDANKYDSTQYGVRGIPHMVIIGKDGKVVNVHTGYSEGSLEGLLREINEAIAKE